MDRKKGKKVVSVLLLLTTVICGAILATTTVPVNHSLNSYGQLDSLITVQATDSKISSSQIRIYNVPVDTIFTRKVYRIQVPTDFSKTMFHHHLDKKLNIYGMDTPAKVHLPEKDMDIYVFDNETETVIRTIRLLTDASLDTLSIIGN